LLYNPWSLHTKKKKERKRRHNSNKKKIQKKERKRRYRGVKPLSSSPPIPTFLLQPNIPHTNFTPPLNLHKPHLSPINFTTP
jgi:hypothetical protein